MVCLFYSQLNLGVMHGWIVRVYQHSSRTQNILFCFQCLDVYVHELEAARSNFIACFCVFVCGLKQAKLFNLFSRDCSAGIEIMRV